MTCCVGDCEGVDVRTIVDASRILHVMDGDMVIGPARHEVRYEPLGFCSAHAPRYVRFMESEPIR